MVHSALLFFTMCIVENTTAPFHFSTMHVVRLASHQRFTPFFASAPLHLHLVHRRCMGCMCIVHVSASLCTPHASLLSRCMCNVAEYQRSEAVGVHRRECIEEFNRCATLRYGGASKIQLLPFHVHQRCNPLHYVHLLLALHLLTISFPKGTGVH